MKEAIKTWVQWILGFFRRHKPSGNLFSSASVAARDVFDDPNKGLLRRRDRSTGRVCLVAHVHIDMKHLGTGMGEVPCRRRRILWRLAEDPSPEHCHGNILKTFQSSWRRKPACRPTGAAMPGHYGIWRLWRDNGHESGNWMVRSVPMERMDRSILPGDGVLV